MDQGQRTYLEAGCHMLPIHLPTQSKYGIELLSLKTRNICAKLQLHFVFH